MANAALKRPRMTAKQYLELERDGTVRHEFVDGIAYMMAGGSLRHNLIINTIVTRLFNSLPNRCRLFSSDVKVHVEATTTECFFYPDLVLTCSDLDSGAYLVKQPSVVIEVLSPSTEDYDRGAKFDAYKLLPSLQEYILVAQDDPGIEVFRRRTGWLSATYGTGERFIIESIATELAVDDVYARVG